MKKLPKSCGSCIFFDKEIPPKEKQLHKYTHREHGKPCAYYEPNPFVLADHRDTIELIAEVINTMPPKYRENLAQVIAYSRHLETFGFKFMELVVVRWRGTSNDNWFNNFISARVLTVNPKTEEARLVSATGSIEISMPIKSLVKLEKWNGMRRRMLKNKRVNDPKYPVFAMPAADVSDAMMAVTNLDDLNDEFLKNLNAKRGRIAKREGKRRRDPISFGTGRKSAKVGPAVFTVIGGSDD